MGIFKKSKSKASTSNKPKKSYPPGSRGPVVGIDLGTTYSCVAVYQFGNVEIIANDHGYRITPSYVAFTETERLLGNAAKDQAIRNPRNTVFDAKRLIGRSSGDETLKNDIKHWPFNVSYEENKPKIHVVYRGEARTFHAEEISAMVLEQMKATAEAYLGQKVYEAVVTVPAYFNDSQRQATKDAGTIAGLDILRIINEPTAAAIAYGLDQNLSNKNIVVYDLGGGTFDVSVLNVDEGIFEVMSTSGDTHLGGSDFDNIITDHFIREFQKKHPVFVESNKRVISRFKVAAEQAKRELSANFQSSVEVENVCDDLDFRYTLSRAKFEDICGPLFRKTLEYIDRALDDARLSKSSVDEVVLVGGSTRIPKIRKLIEDYFSGFLGNKTKINTEINPDEAIAYGAAIQAAILCTNEKKPDETIDNMLLLDVAPLSLGIETMGGIMSNIVTRNTTVPVRSKRMFSTAQDNQTCVTIQVFEGESKKTSENRILGRFDLHGLPQAPRGSVPIEVTFDVDANGILNVSAEELSSGNKRSIKIENNKGRLTSTEINNMIVSAEQITKENKGQSHNRGNNVLVMGNSEPIMEQIAYK